VRYAIARADPELPAGLYRDSRNRSVAKLLPVSREIPWGGKQELRPPSKLVKMRAQYPAGEQVLLVLPHTDISRDKFFVSLRAPSAPPTYMLENKHFEIEPLQGGVAFTDAGRLLLERYQSAAGGDAVLDIAYLVRPSIAGMVTHRPEGERFILAGDGASQARYYGGDVSEHAGSSDPADDGKKSWFQRSLSWLMAD